MQISIDYPRMGELQKAKFAVLVKPEILSLSVTASSKVPGDLVEGNVVFITCIGQLGNLTTSSIQARIGKNRDYLKGLLRTGTL